MFKVTASRAMQPTQMMFMRQSPALYMRQTARMRTPVPKEEQAAHGVSQRLRQLRNMPAELIPLFVVVGVACGFAVYSLGKKLVVDRTLRLKRQAGNN